MKVCRPALDDTFLCLAGDCPDTCCAGWILPIDEKSTVRYQSMTGPWGDRLRRSMVQTEEGWQFRQENGRCCLLNEKGLCNLYAEQGWDALCNTCQLHPRFVIVYGGLREIMPGLSCPAWSEKWLMQEGTAAFITEQTEEPPQMNTIDGALFYHLMKGRTAAIEIAQRRDMPILQRMATILELAEKWDGVSETEPVHGRAWPVYRRKLQGLEILTEQWRERLAAPQKRAIQPWRDLVCEQLLVYYLFRFWLFGVYDGRVLPWAKFALWSVLVICQVGAGDASREQFCETARLYAKEVEHNAEHISALHRVMCRRTGYYSAQGVRQAWEELK